MCGNLIGGHNVGPTATTYSSSHMLAEGNGHFDLATAEYSWSCDDDASTKGQSVLSSAYEVVSEDLT